MRIFRGAANIRYFFCVLNAILLVARASLALEAYAGLENAEEGQASLFTRAGRCYALIPKHVLGASQYVKTLKAAGEVNRGKLGQGDVCARLDGTDVALLTVSGLPVGGCGIVMSVVPSAESMVPEDKLGIVQSVNQNGSIERRSVVITFMGTSDELEVTAIHESDRLTPGLSGSTLYVSGLAAGLLVSVETFGSGAGRVLRLDSIYSSLFRLFDAGSGAEIADPSCLQAGRISVGTRAPEAGIDFAAPLDGGQVVVSWSAPPLSSLHRPEILLAPPEQGGYWAVQTAHKASVIIRLSENPETVNRVVVSVHHMPRDERPAYLAAYSRASERGPWTALPTPSDGFAHDLDEIELRFGPRRIEEIMVEVGAPESRRNVVGLSRISIFRTATR